MKVIDLFAGCGGLSRGFMNAGFDVVAAYENWTLAADVYSRNFDHPVHCFDLSQVNEAIEHIKQYAPDMIIGGPPCQDFSIAGKRKEESRADLTISFATIASKIRPSIVVMENVYNITRSKHLDEAIRLLKEANYGISSRVIDASLTGVPQRRKRYFLIAILNGPDNLFDKALDGNLATIPMTVRKYFGKNLNLEHYYAHPRTYKRRAIFSVDEPSSTIRRVNRPIPKNYVKHPADKADVSDKLRPLTTKERSLIQTFPEDFVFLGTPSQQEHLIGNAVPVKLAEYVARSIQVTLKSRKLRK
jgi:DNA (cytosine-5)-methyltransferase 1